MSTPANNDNNNEENPSRKCGKGRRKVVMEKMQNKANLQVTFSKRRNGLFKKASELSARCGAEAAVVLFSPGGKPFTFGHPSVETIADRFLKGDDNADDPPPTAEQLVAQETERQEIASATARLNNTMDRLNQANHRGKELEEITEQLGKRKLIAEGTNYTELIKLRDGVLMFKEAFEAHEEAREKSLAVTTYEFLGPSPNVGTETNHQLVEPAAGSSFGPPFGTNLQGFPDYFYGSTSGGINLFGNNIVPLVSYYHAGFAGTSTANFPDTAGYNIPMWNDNSNFVIPYTPLAIDPSAARRNDDTENEPSGHGTGNDAGGAGK